VASIEQLAIFWPCYRHRARRLRDLTDAGHIRRLPREYVQQGFLYYTNKPPAESHVKHYLAVVDFYIACEALCASLRDQKVDCVLSAFEPHDAVAGPVADASIEIWCRGNVHSYFLEIQRQNYFDFAKYEKAYTVYTKGEDFPIVLIVAKNRFKLKSSKIRYVVGSIDEVIQSMRNAIKPLK